MNKLNREIIKSIKKLNAETTASYKLFFAELKQKGIVAFDNWAWNSPTTTEFKCFGTDAKRYMQRLYTGIMVKNVDVYEIRELIDCPDTCTFVTKDELKKFETVTYPKLYAKWQAEQKQTCASEAQKIRDKIAKLQKQLRALEA